MRVPPVAACARVHAAIRRRRTGTLLGVILGIVAAAILAGGRPAAAITNGQPDIANRYNYVGLVTDGRLACSGSLIAPTIFLTAAHCFDQPGKTVFVTVVQDVRTARQQDFVTGQWFPDPDFCGSTCPPGLPGSSSQDVAVVVLRHQIKVSRYALLPTPGLVDTLAVGTPVTLVGYGVQDFARGGGQPQPVTDFARYFAPATLLAGSEAFTQRDALTVSSTPGQDQGGVCFGDSGSPVLRGGTDIILGLVSHGASPLCASVSYAYRIDNAAALAFIQGGYRTASATASGPR
jgi:secreted trypsin-like serine protease